ncbi:MAG: hypothetical protein DRP63_00900 [Planctomycetota bacterium]|nr:MAG: hypothetical protein DRP63_00900 [Planctomycetota bacterium]
MEKTVVKIAETVSRSFGDAVFEPLRDYLLLLITHIRVPEFNHHRLVREEALASVRGFGPALLCALFLLNKEIEVPFEEFLDTVTAVVASPLRMPQERFGALLKRLRRQRNMTLVELAKKLAVARGYLHAIERGRSLPSVNLLARIVEILDPDGREGLAVAGVAARLPHSLKQILFARQDKT